MKRKLLQVLAAVTALALAGCSAQHYRQSADREAGRLLREKSRQVRNAGSNIDVAQTNAVELGQLPTRLEIPTFLGTEGTNEAGAMILSLQESLRLAVQHNRTYQSRKEQFYLSALSLALARHQWTPIFSGSSAAQVAAQVDELAGTQIGSTSDNLVERQQVSATGTINANWLIRDAGLLTASVTTDFLRFLIGDPRTVTSSRTAATFTRPLLRNAGYQQQMENLTLAERSLLYELRDFSQFRKDFSVQVATAYYRVLGERDAVKNSFLNLQSSKRNAERTRRLAEEGRVSQADHGRLEQQKLDAQNTYIGALQEYKESLNNFKLQQLGLPVKLNLVLDDKELEQLAIKHPAIGRDVRVGGSYYRIVGIIEPASRSADNEHGSGDGVAGSTTGEMLIPLTTARARYGNVLVKNRTGNQEMERVELHEITLKVRALEEVARVAEAVRQVIEHTHRKKDYEIVVPLELLRRAERTKRIFNVVLGSIAAISLVVGGIGIMNIMLATVTERTREIGIRRALGARRKDIVIQFLIETVILAGAGGSIGVLLGMIVPQLVTQFAGMKTIVTLWAPALAFTISAIVGIVFGIYPALHAAKMDPVEALRHE